MVEIAHPGLMVVQVWRRCIERQELIGVAVVSLIRIALLALAQIAVRK